MTEKHFKSAQQVKDSSGRQYHIGVAPGELHRHILLCGDPARAEKVAKHFTKIDFERRHREYVTISGVYNGVPVSVLATGIGCDNTEIALVELSQCVENPVLLRIGTCGTLVPEIELGSVIISSAALRFENTSSFFAPIEYPAVADYKLVALAEKMAKTNGVDHHIGFTATCSGFYGAQERASGVFKPFETGRLDRLAEIGVVNLEMEASTLFVLASIAKLRAGAICTVYANRPRDVFIDPAAGKDAEERLIKLGLAIMEQDYLENK